MEYESPGTSFWTTLLVTLVILGNTEMAHVAGKHHRIRHSHYQTDTYNHQEPFEDLDYEDSTVMLKPEFLNTRTTITVVEGSMATLPCAVRYLGTKEVTWRLLGAKDDHFLTVGDFTWVRENNIQVDYKAEEGQITHWNLIIKSVKLSDQGMYQCQVTEKIPIRTKVNLIVKKRPEREPSVFITGKEYVDRNEPIHLQCNATGGPRIPEEIDWFKDGTKIDPSNPKFKDVLLTKYMSLEHHAMISELIIEKTDESDTGTYICRSSDRKIVSRKVTVLVAADTTNVKRGTGAKEEAISAQIPEESHGEKPHGGENGGASQANCVSILFVMFSILSAIGLSRL